MKFLSILLKKNNNKKADNSSRKIGYVNDDISRFFTNQYGLNSLERKIHSGKYDFKENELV